MSDNPTLLQFLSGGELTLRDLLVMAAPPEPQPWFAPDMPQRPARPDTSHLSDEERDQLEEGSAVTDTNESFVEFFVRYAEAEKAGSAWDAEWERQRYLQWPGAWADGQLKLRAEREGASNESGI